MDGEHYDWSEYADTLSADSGLGDGYSGSRFERGYAFGADDACGEQNATGYGHEPDRYDDEDYESYGEGLGDNTYGDGNPDGAGSCDYLGDGRGYASGYGDGGEGNPDKDESTGRNWDDNL